MRKRAGICSSSGLLVLALLLPGSRCLIAAENPSFNPPGDKTQYNLFHPTPPELMRELSADRPDKTESPFTVDAGHFQFETDLANYTYDRQRSEHEDVRVDAYQFANSNFKVGLFNDLDLQLVIEAGNFQRIDDRTAGVVTEKSGFGDVIPRIKYNLWGNDGGRTAMALLPFVKIPSNQDHLANNAVEGGIRIPLAIEVPGWDLSLMTEFDYNHNETIAGYHVEFINSISLGHQLFGKLSASVEFFSGVSTERNSDWVGTLDTWLTYNLNPNVRLDCGVYIGVTRAADDLHPFIGLTWRH